MEGGLACSAGLQAAILGAPPGWRSAALCADLRGSWAEEASATFGDSPWGRSLSLSQAHPSGAPLCSLQPRGGRVSCCGRQGVPLRWLPGSLAPDSGPYTLAFAPVSGLHAAPPGPLSCTPLPPSSAARGRGVTGPATGFLRHRYFRAQPAGEGFSGAPASPYSLLLFPVFIPLD